MIMHEYTGFYEEWKDLQKEYPDCDFEFLENKFIAKIDEQNLNAYDYLHGYCDSFAFSLQQQFGYEIQAIYDENHSLVHAYCISLDQTQTAHFIDVRGCTTDFQAFLSDFEDFITITEDEPLHIEAYKDTDKDMTQIENTIQFIQKYKNYYIPNTTKGEKRL